MNTQTIKLNLIPGGIPPIVHVSQYDVGRPLAFELYDGLNAATIEAGTVIDIRATKPDGTGFSYACTWVNNIVSIVTQTQMTVCSGSIECELHLVKDSQEIDTANFILEVEAAALRGDTDISETDIPVIVDAARSSAAAAASSASDSEAYAVGKRGGVDVANTDPTYHNNSKYYAGEAADSENAAGLSATAAESSANDSEAYAVGKRDGVDVPNTDPTYHNNSKYYAGEAADSENAAGLSATAAESSASDSEAYAVGKRGGQDVPNTDPTYQNNSKHYADSAAASATAAATSKSDSEAYAVGTRGGVDVPATDPTHNNNAKYYAEVAQQAAAGGIIPKGTTTFALLPNIASSAVGDMWNISDDFTTTADFREGAGHTYEAGSNVYKTADGKWDVMGGLKIEKSYVGMIIHSTTLDTEAKVKAFYGGTTWILHDGYMLRGASTGVINNQNQSDGGASTVTPAGTNAGGAVQSHTLVGNELPTLSGTISSMGSAADNGSNTGLNCDSSTNFLSRNDTTQTFSKATNVTTITGKTVRKLLASFGGNQGHTHALTQPTFTGIEHTNLPPYKDVYIWERTA